MEEFFTNYNITPTKICIYYRVSTKMQADVTNGLDKQTELCESYAKSIFNTKITSIDYYCDIGSSYNDVNALKQLNKLTNKIEPNTVILISDVSRIGRNAFQVFKTLQRIKKSNCKIIAVTDNLCYNNNNKLMDKRFYHKIIDAETFSDKKSIKSSNIYKNLKNNGGHIGKAPFGFTVEKVDNTRKLIKNENEQKTINSIKEKYVQLQDFNLVAEHFNSKNILNRKNVWNKNSIKKILHKHFPETQTHCKTNQPHVKSAVVNNLNVNNITL